MTVTENKRSAVQERTNEENYLIWIVTPLVDHPSDVEVIRTTDEKGVLLTLHVHPDDMGRVVGRDGQVAQAMRTLLRPFGKRSSLALSLKIHDPRKEAMGQSRGIADPFEKVL